MSTIVFLTILLLCINAEVLIEKSIKPTLWRETRKAEDTTLLQLVFALKQQNVDKIEQKLWSVSTPGSPEYGKYLSVEEVADIVAPSKYSIHRITKWLEANGAVNIRTVLTKDFILASFTVLQASKILSTSFCWFEHPTQSPVVRSCERQYSLPSDIAQLVDFVGGVLYFPEYHVKPVIQKSVAVGIAPKGLRTKYGIPEGTYSTNPNNSQCVTGFLNQWFSPGDLSAFLRTYSPDLEGQTIVKTVGPNTPSEPGTEADLDVQYVIGIGAKVPSWFWSTRTSDPNQDPFILWLVDASNTHTLPLIFSVSYGGGEQGFNYVYLTRSNLEFIKLGLRGVTVMAASGDNGAGCFNNRFEANWIAVSPYVTSVGGTSPGEFGESAASLSSGGFSNYFSRPSYQQKAVERYFSQSGLPATSLWNASGRAYPDLSAAAENVLICQYGFCGLPVAGTSCASPIFAGIVGLLNDARLNAGKPPLGFLNPLLYKIAEQTDYPFNDITTGEGQGGCGSHGFPAKVGWDAVTGLGSPNFPKLLKAINNV